MSVTVEGDLLGQLDEGDVVAEGIAVPAGVDVVLSGCDFDTVRLIDSRFTHVVSAQHQVKESGTVPFKCSFFKYLHL